MAKTFVVACGGTGGHVFPGLAVADELDRRGHTVEVWLAGRDIESCASGDRERKLFATGMRQISLRTLPHAARAVWRCLERMKELKPDALLAMGSYSSLPPALTACLRRVPVVLHEANAVPGRAVETLSRYAAMTAYSFAGTERWLPGRRVCHTGLPVRADLCGCGRFEEIPAGVFTFLVTGGSQGARRVNDLVAQAMCLLKQSGAEDFYVIHQCGRADEDRLRELYHTSGVNAKVSAFIREMGSAYASADFVIARAGASTCCELCLLGKPALLIPLPEAKRDHQHLNAAALMRGGGVDEGIQGELSGRSVMRFLQKKMKSPEKLAAMGAALKAMAVPDAAARVADVMEAV
ncbi:MAG: UDP-N-acetylglucosamine--N-acetylmuramyl-(pentapeptide) pyrophosphoryl-undecaprenol N-acetylglucosamine transferase [Kiritimatiellae bacterium]|nr:UDP-N-acetylglucosamine--N-acetylmuramyl-(pentapeptide) pyrophosphoryl-undecaprenol N-acetylglucosamine transferase [Kiritimatiellia bacterium]